MSDELQFQPLRIDEISDVLGVPSDRPEEGFRAVQRAHSAQALFPSRAWRVPQPSTSPVSARRSHATAQSADPASSTLPASISSTTALARSSFTTL